VPLGRQSRSVADKLPFWVHQLTEYLLGFMVVTQAVRSASPAIPTASGGVIVALAAVVDGPLSAANLVSRPVHRWIDAIVAAALVVVAVAFRAQIGNGTAVSLGLAAMVMTFLVVRSDYRVKPRRAVTSPKLRRPMAPGGEIVHRSRGAQAERLGRRAGRGAGTGARWIKRRIDKR